VLLALQQHKTMLKRESSTEPPSGYAHINIRVAIPILHELVRWCRCIITASPTAPVVIVKVIVAHFRGRTPPRAAVQDLGFMV
jgi:hypothetical protein